MDVQTPAAPAPVSRSATEAHGALPPGGSDLIPRVLVALVGIPLAATAVWRGGWVLGVAAAVVAAQGAREVCRLGERTGVRPFTAVGCAAAAAYPLAAAARPALEPAAPVLWILTLALLLGCAAAAAWRRGPGGRPLEATAVTVAASLFTGGTLACLVLLRHLPLRWSHPEGHAALALLPLVLAWTGDTAAFAVGRSFGRTPLSPVSPRKTREGAVAGVLASVVAGSVFAALLLPAEAGLGAAWGALAGLVAAGVGLAGDLAKSAWKRAAGVKDSGRLFPGHGGVLDRFDSTFYAVTAILLLVLATGALREQSEPAVEIGLVRAAPASGPR